VDGALGVPATAKVAPGTATTIGTLTHLDFSLGQPVTFAGGSALDVRLAVENTDPFEIAASDRLHSLSAIQFAIGPGNGGDFVLNVDGQNLSGFVPHTTYQYMVMEAGVGITGFDPNHVTINPTNFVTPGTFSLTLNGTQALVLSYTPVPEPAGILALFLGAAGAAGWVRKRRQKAMDRG
jgi:hypothetical protein